MEDKIKKKNCSFPIDILTTGIARDSTNQNINESKDILDEMGYGDPLLQA